jgi:nucleoside-diphosphate-sugar epimerase
MPFWVARLGLPFITAYSKISGNDPLYTKESLEIIECGNRNVSNQKSRNELGFFPRDFDETIKDTFVWFRENGFLT